MTRDLFPSHCQRCGAKLLASIMSKFNTDVICPPCETKERAHPRYAEACAAELAACRRGDYNYPGIGKPADLWEAARAALAASEVDNG